MYPPRQYPNHLLIRAVLLLLSVALALPAYRAGWSAVKSAAFVVEFLSDGRFPVLTGLTIRPIRSFHLLGTAAHPIPADLYRPARLLRVPGLVLVHGLSPQGKNNPSLQRAARLFSRAGMMVMVPTVDGLTTLRLRPEDARAVVLSLEQLKASQGVDGRRLRLLGVSVGAGPALLAAADPGVANSVEIVVSLGGYASTRELLRYFLTGAYRYGGEGGQRLPQPEAARHFLLQNLDLLKSREDRRRLSELFGKPERGSPTGLGPEGQAVYRLIENRDPAMVDPLINALPQDLKKLLDELSPTTHLTKLRARLVLLHSINDPAIPFTESLRLADAARGVLQVKLTLLHLLGHVEPGEEAVSQGKALGELAKIWSVLYQLLRA